MEIIDVSFKKENKKLFLFVYYSNGKFKKYIVKNKYREYLFNLLVVIMLDK